MRKQTVAVCDKDQAYIEAFAGRAGRQKTTGLEVRGFTSADALLKFLEKDVADLVLVEEKLVTKEIQEACSGKLVRLTEKRDRDTAKHNEGDSDDLKTIYKYQACSDLIRQILDILSEQRNLFQKVPSGSDFDPDVRERTGKYAAIVQKPAVKCLGVFSTAGRCGKTMFALALATHLEKKGPTLFISFEYFPGWRGVVPELKMSGGSLLDGVYYLRNGNLKVAEKLLAVEQKIGEVSVLPPCPDPQDLLHVTDEEWSLILNSLKYETGYEYIVADLGAVPAFCPAILLNFSEIFVPLPPDETAQGKWNDFQEYLQKNLLDQEMEKRMKQIRIKEERRRTESGLEELLYGEAGKLAERVIQEENL